MKRILLLSLVAMGLTACQTMYVPQAREVKKKPRSNGVIAMPTTYRPEDRTRAEELMKANCGALAVNVTDEGEMTVGQETKSNTNTTNRDDSRKSMGNLFGMNIMSGQNAGTDASSSSVTKELKEWQIIYDCTASAETPRATKAKR